MLSAHEIEDIVDRLRVWLRETSEELDDPNVVALAERLIQSGSQRGENGSAAAVGSVQIADAFTALRHEIKLQTKGLRGLQENVQANLQTVAGAVDELQDARRSARQAAEEATETAARPLLNALLDVDEAIGQAVAAVETAVTRQTQQAPAAETSAQRLIAELDAEFQRISAWQRLWLRGFWVRVRARLDEAFGGESPHNQSATETLAGLQMLRSRLRRVLADTDVEPMSCLGHRFDPHTMRVVDTVQDATQPPETVVEEVRTGYRWKGMTLRLAEVRATKPRPPESP
jgi:molecular chaperone GrpE